MRDRRVSDVCCVCPYTDTCKKYEFHKNTGIKLSLLCKTFRDRVKR